MEDSVPVRLLHSSVYVVAGVAELCDLLGKQLHPAHRITENYALIDLQLKIVTCQMTSHVLMDDVILNKSNLISFNQ